MKTFFRDLVTANTGLSSKRFISILGFIILVGVIVCTIFGLKIPDIVFVTLASIILGSEGLTVVQKNNNNNN